MKAPVFGVAVANASADVASLREDRRPAGERNAAKRYLEPSLFTVLERSR